jgi:hypothetical protein
LQVWPAKSWRARSSTGVLNLFQKNAEADWPPIRLIGSDAYAPWMRTRNSRSCQGRPITISLLRTWLMEFPPGLSGLVFRRVNRSVTACSAALYGSPKALVPSAWNFEAQLLRVSVTPVLGSFAGSPYSKITVIDMPLPFRSKRP